MPPSNTKKPQDRQQARKTTRKAVQDTPIPVPEDPTSKYAPDAWMGAGVGGMEDVRVPSGQLCLVRRPGLQGLMTAGILHNVDSLTAIVNERHLKQTAGKADAEIDMQSLMNDPKALEDVMHVMDRAISYCVVKPEIHMTPGDVTRRQPGVVYADMVDLVDKIFLFNYVVGGTRDLERFRGDLDQLVGSVEAGEGVGVEAK